MKLFIQRLAGFAQNCWRSHIAWLLATLHAGWFILAIANMSPPSPGFARFLESMQWASATMFAGRPFHFTYESVYLKALLLLDLPSLVVAALLGMLFLPLNNWLHISLYLSSYVEAVLLLSLATLQWYAVGGLIQSGLRAANVGIFLDGRVKRYCVMLIVLILVCTCILAPVINMRSRTLGYRHPAISVH